MNIVFVGSAYVPLRVRFMKRKNQSNTFLQIQMKRKLLKFSYEIGLVRTIYCFIANKVKSLYYYYMYCLISQNFFCITLNWGIFNCAQNNLIHNLILNNSNNLFFKFDILNSLWTYCQFQFLKQKTFDLSHSESLSKEHYTNWGYITVL